MIALRAFAESFSRVAGGRMGSVLRCRVQMHLESINQTEWGELGPAISTPAVLASFDLAGAGTVIAHLPIGLAMVAIDLYLAGSGTGPFPSRPLTDMERQLIAVFLDVVSSETASAASAILGPVEAGPVTQLVVQASEARDRAEQCVVLHFSLRIPHIGRADGLDICIPTATLRPLLGRVPDAPGRAEAPVLPAAERLVEGVPLTLSLRFPPVAVPLSVAESLSAGQVLSLAHPLGAPLPLYVGDRPLFTATPVVHAKRAACQIVSGIDTEDL